MNNKIITALFFLFLLILVLLGALIFGISDQTLISKFNSLSTILLTIFTLIYVFLTYLILRSNNKMIAEQNRPFVIFNLPTEGTYLILSIKNIGKRPAYDVNINTNPELKNFVTLKGFTFDKSVFPLLSQKFLPPGIDIRNIIGQTMQVIEMPTEEKKIEVSIGYHDSFGNKYSENYNVDLNNTVSNQKTVRSISRSIILKKYQKI